MTSGNITKMYTEFQKAVKKAFDYPGVHRLVCRRDGSVEVKRSYFYHPYTSAEWAEKVQKVLAKAGVQCKVTGRDSWKDWPQISYLIATVVPVEAEEVGGEDDSLPLES
jgi:hypothetical protein